MNSQGQSLITVFFYVGIFLTVWALAFASLINDWGHAAVTMNHLTGLEALLYNNLNPIIMFVLVISVFAITAVGANN